MGTVAVMMDTAIVQEQIDALGACLSEARLPQHVLHSLFRVLLGLLVNVAPGQNPTAVGTRSRKHVVRCSFGTVTVNCSPQPGQVSRRSSAIRFKNSSPLILPERGVKYINPII